MNKKKVTPKKKRVTKKELESLVIFSHKNKIYSLLRQRGEKTVFSLLSGKGDLVKIFNKTAKKANFISKGFEIDFAKAKYFHVTEFSKDLILSFVNNKQTYFASSKDALHWKVVGVIENVFENGCLAPVKNKDKSFVYYYGDKEIKVAFGRSLTEWQHNQLPILQSRSGFFDKCGLKVVRSITTEKGVGLMYQSACQNSGKRQLFTGFALFSKDDYSKIIWRSDSPLTDSFVPAGPLADIRCLGAILREGIYYIYYRFGTKFFVISGRDPFFTVHHVTKKLIRFDKNPIISPKEAGGWQAVGAFNPGAVCLDGGVHLVYRAVGNDGMSTLGHALLQDALHVKSSSDKPIYIIKSNFDLINHVPKFDYKSGPGGLGGCEDPRLIKIGDDIYMIYVAFNGYEAPRVALTCIKEADFLNKKWEWRKPVFLSKKGQTQKNWVLFPEKINGKFALLTSLSPEVQIFYFDKLPTKDINIESKFKNKPGVRRWDNWMRGVGAPPIRTEFGWLILYHAMDVRDPNRYKVGAMILDYNNPENILYRSINPILEPDKHYENEGFKAGVVYVCGTVVLGDTLYVYYGGADTVVCVATIPFKEFLNSLITESQKETGHDEIRLI